MRFRTLSGTSGVALLVVMLAATTACKKPVVGGSVTLAYARTFVDREKAISPLTRIFRQYVSGSEYLQFDRVDGDVLYGYLACPTCSYQRVPFAAVFDGTYLYAAFTRQEAFFTDNAYNSVWSQHSDWFQFAGVHKFQVDGRNLVRLEALYSCNHLTQWNLQWPRWSPKKKAFLCAKNHIGTGNVVSALFVATVDDYVAGEASSIVEQPVDAPVEVPPDEGSQEDDAAERLRKLRALREQGLIDEATFKKKEQEILDGL